MYAFAQLETAQRGACADFVAELLNTVVNAPVTASDVCQGLQDLARQLARAVHMAPEVQVKAQVPMREFLLQRWRAAMARQEIEVSPFLTHTQLVYERHTKVHDYCVMWRLSGTWTQ
eukprot:TRINITY_DN20638_c0_g1_i4.p1 TRINITY_DN20638_c0_g1~~TRINITY_DN20638_c0_g1_i4.p1  ORF type:complete len:126 (-),score=13.60 TRINITY_DN20638_c0_g1_i4:136-486(-)